MEPTIPWYQSAIVRQQIVMVIVGVLGLFNIVTELDIDATVAAVMAGIAAIVPVVTILTRLFKPTPPITESAAAKTAAIAPKLAAEERAREEKK